MTTTIDGEVLNDLLRINKDRILGYERAIAELNDTEDADLKQLFRNYIENSNGFIAKLSGALINLEEPVASTPTAMGKIYSAWMEIKAFFTGNDRQTILNSCEAMEDAAKKAYESALNQPGMLPDTFLLIEQQNNQLLKAHSQVKNYGTVKNNGITRCSNQLRLHIQKQYSAGRTEKKELLNLNRFLSGIRL